MMQNLISVSLVFSSIWGCLLWILSISQLHDGIHSFIIALGCPALLFFAIALKKYKRNEAWGFVWRFRQEHVVQTFAQLTVYLAWLTAWQPIQDHIPLLVAQILFAYLIDMLLSWNKYSHYRFGFAPIPIVCSTNLFLFFKPELFMWQWVLIAFAFSSRELFRWKRKGRDVHIFNPSAIALSIAALILIYSEQMHLSWGADIARAHGFSSYSYEVIFLSGIVVSTFFTVGFTISSAVISSVLIGEFYFEWTGLYRYVDSSIPIAVFLGMNLLVTDPVTSPHRRDAKCVYGFLYALSVFILYGYLRDLERLPTSDTPGLTAAFCDKLLAVPLLNLCSPWLDQMMAYLTQKLPASLRHIVRHSTWKSRILFSTCWILIFVSWIQPNLREFPGNSLSFWDHACQTQPMSQHPYTCENRNRLYLKSCEQGAAKSCHNLASAYENGEGVKIDLSIAASLYKKACHQGLANSCNYLGGLLAQEYQKTQHDQWLSQAWNALEIACQGSIADSCLRQAMLLKWQQTRPTIQGEARRDLINTLYQKACRLKNPQACFQLSQWSMANPLMREQACQQGEALACAALKRIQQTTHTLQEIRTHELVFVHQELQVACQGEIPMACAHLGWLYWQGDGVVAHAQQAMSYMQKACRLKAPQSCKKLQMMQHTHAQ